MTMRARVLWALNSETENSSFAPTTPYSLPYPCVAQRVTTPFPLYTEQGRKGGGRGSWKEARTKHAETKPRLKMIKAKSVRRRVEALFLFFFFHRRVACLNVTGSFVVPCKRVQARLPTIVVFVLSSDSLFIVPFLRRGKIPPLLSLYFPPRFFTGIMYNSLDRILLFTLSVEKCIQNRGWNDESRLGVFWRYILIEFLNAWKGDPPFILPRYRQ